MHPKAFQLPHYLNQILGCLKIHTTGLSSTCKIALSCLNFDFFPLGIASSLQSKTKPKFRLSRIPLHFSQFTVYGVPNFLCHQLPITDESRKWLLRRAWTDSTWLRPGPQSTSSLWVTEYVYHLYFLKHSFIFASRTTYLVILSAYLNCPLPCSISFASSWFLLLL